MRKIGIMLALWAAFAAPAAAEDFPSSAGTLRVTTVAEGLEHPWSLAFLPDGGMLVTERPGRLRMVTPDGTLSAPVGGVPTVFAEGQGGLLDVALDPAFAQNRMLYLSYAEEVDGKAATAVAKAKLAAGKLESFQVIFRQQPKVRGPNHWGSRLVFARDGTLFVTLGERFNERKRAQTLDTHMGKIIRIRTDGTAPPDNPFVNARNALPEIWSYGHRNIQGAARHPETGDIWVVEHGPRGGDEVNRAQAGKNYGWPLACYGSHYDGTDIPDDHAGRGFAEPVYYWTPSIAPSGLMFYSGRRLQAWKGDLFVGALAGMSLVRLDMEGGKVVKEERLFEDLGERLRDVREGPDGLIYLLTDSPEGRILRVAPKL